MGDGGDGGGGDSSDSNSYSNYGSNYGFGSFSDSPTSGFTPQTTDTGDTGVYSGNYGGDGNPVGSPSDYTGSMSLMNPFAGGYDNPGLSSIFNMGDSLVQPNFSAQEAFGDAPNFAGNLGVSDPTFGDNVSEYWNRYKQHIPAVLKGLGLAARITGTAINPAVGLGMFAASQFNYGKGPNAQSAGQPQMQQIGFQPSQDRSSFINRSSSIDPLLMTAGRFQNVGVGKEVSNNLNQQRTDLASLYGPDSAYAKQMRSNLERQDAARGRRSDFAGREVQLQAALADAASRNAGVQRQLTLDKGAVDMNLVRDKTLRNQDIVNGIKDLRGLYDVYKSFEG